MLVTNRHDSSRNVVIVPQSDWESISETLHVYENPDYHDMLLARAADVHNGKTEKHALLGT